ncbi:MAG: hypothetical protein AAF942_08410, partial [Pseudomonadota bacterium]
VSSNVFAYPSQLDASRLDNMIGLTFRQRIFVLLNGNTRSAYEPAAVDIESIAERSLKALMLNQSNRDVERVYHLSRRDGFEFRLISIPDDFNAGKSADFDRDYMRDLLALGRELGRGIADWPDRPPEEIKD